MNDLVPGGFNHYEQSLRIVDVLEQDRRGLNLTWEVRDGIARHSKGKTGLPVGAPPELRASTIEGQIARVADIVAYVNHDIDDAQRAGIISDDMLPVESVRRLGHTSSERIGRLVTNVVEETLAGDMTEVRMSQDVLDAMLALRAFMFDAVYENHLATAEFGKAARHPRWGSGRRFGPAPAEFLDLRTVEEEGLDRAAQDFLAGMTDRYAVNLFEQLYIPKPWVTVTDEPRVV